MPRRFALPVSRLGSPRLARKHGPVRITPIDPVKENVLVSDGFPKIRVKVDPRFRYVGSFSFVIPGMAEGERYVFVDARAERVNRLFIAQFEGILPTSTETYNYGFATALSLGGHRFRENTFAFSNRKGREENPASEGPLTVDFLTRNGYVVEDEMMASRLVTVPDPERKHELILFYMESIAGSGHRLEAFYQGDDRTPLWQGLSQDLTKRALESFRILGQPGPRGDSTPTAARSRD